MANNLLLSIAKTHLITKIKQSSIAALGVTFGIAAFIILTAFMTGLNGMLDNLVLNRTPHIHIYNEIKQSEKQPIDYVDQAQNSLNIVHNIKPKQSQKRVHNAQAIISQLSKDERVLGVTPQDKAFT